MNARLLLLLTIIFGLLLGSASCSSDPVPSNQTSSGTTAGLGEQCTVGQTNCGAGCVDTLSNSGNCGQCGTICPAGTACVNGACGCQAGLSDCSGSCVNAQIDNNNCGGCGIVCPAGQSCLAGQCSCTTGTACGAACVDTTLDPANCGGCSQACQNVQQCAAGVCQCRAGLTDCGAGCSNPLSDPQNCGGCGAACVAPQVCSQGACSAECAVGLTNCSGACEDTLTSPLNCGGCGNQCAAGQDCVNGACTCAGGLTDCAGTCINTMSDAANCGGCGVACGAGQSCSGGSCSCAAGQQSCADPGTGVASCRDVQSDSSNCGSCGMSCAGGQTCSGGVCSCPVGQELCDGSCVAAGSCNPTTTTTTGTLTSTSTTSTTSTTGAGGGTSTSTTNTSTTGGGSCTFTVEDTLSDTIGTVGIVTFSVSGVTVTKAEIQFTKDGGGPTYVAPVDLAEANYRTLLLGMKGQSTYNYQIIVNDGECSSPMRTIMTGPVANNVPDINHQAQNPGSATTTGFIVLSAGLGGFGAPGGGGGAPAFIIDMDGDPVWWAAAPASCSRARMDWEGKNMWMLELNVDRQGGEMRRIAMDGTDAQNNIQGLNNAHHDFTVLPGGIVATVSWGSGSGGGEPPSDLLERAPDGTITKVATLDSNFYNAGPQGFHANSILWHESDQSYTVGDRYPNLYIKLTRSGQLVWQFGGQNPVDQSKYISAGSWSVNHGHHLLDNGNLIIFNNGNGGQSPVIEFSLNVAGGTASEVWRYTGGSSNVLGDVQRLENGNTLVTYSVSGVIQEVSQSGSVLQQYSTDSLGYATYRPSLYGPPPK